MGMYTEVFIRAEIDREAYEILTTAKVQRYAHGLSRDLEPVLFGESWYFPHGYHFETALIVNGPGPTYFLSVRSSLKNYNGEIQQFVNWLAPHLVRDRDEREEFLGYTKYEESDPVFLYA